MTTGPASTLADQLASLHLDAGYNLGRWLLGNEHDAADAVHDAFVRALHSADGFAGGNMRSWWLVIVRNCCLARLAGRGRDAAHQSLDATPLAPEPLRSEADAVEAGADAAQRRALVATQLRRLPEEFREILVLREFEDLSYREIADVLKVPIGTVMSRLSRARAVLQRALAMEDEHGL